MKVFFLSLIMFPLLVVPLLSFAQTDTPSIFSGINIWAGAYCGSSSTIALDQGPQGPCDFCDAIIIASNIMRYAFDLIFFVLFPIFFAWGGIQYMTSAGNPGKIKSAKQILISTIVGLVIAASAWLVIGLIFNVLGGFSGNTFSISPWKTINCQ
jgi:hypothetical protein